MDDNGINKGNNNKPGKISANRKGSFKFDHETVDYLKSLVRKNRELLKKEGIEI